MFSLVGSAAAAALTLVTLSYVIGDHRLFRIVLFLFVGVSAGYAGAVVVEDIVFPYLVFPLSDLLVGSAATDIVELSIRTGLSLLLLSKLTRRGARLGNPITALLTGTGAALATEGAVLGTILPQLGSASGTFNVVALRFALQEGYIGESIQIFLEGVLLLLGTVSTLAFFHFGAKKQGNQEPIRNKGIDTLAHIGRIFIAITLASLFSGVLIAALGALVERLSFLTDVSAQLIGIP
jgi:hypothetical protein